MALNFPASPTVGQSYTSGGKTWIWDGTVWNSQAALFVTPTSTDTLTNKTINLANNTVTGTLQQFNQAVSDGDFVTTNTEQTLSNKNIQGSTYSGVIDKNGSERSNVVSVGVGTSIDCSQGNYFTASVSANRTYTFTNVPSSRAYSFVLEVAHTSGTITWPSSVQWPAGTAPTLTTGKTHLFVFVTDDGGTRWRGAANINYTT